MITRISPVSNMNLLSQIEVDQLQKTASSDVYNLYRNCSLAVLNTGSETDSSTELLEQFKNFDINVLSRERGVQLELINPPQDAFVDSKIIRSIRENMFSILRDIVHVNIFSPKIAEINNASDSSPLITNLIFDILRNAKILQTDKFPNLIVCWGGHSINREEYLYTKDVGYELGLRDLNICTGCGPGAMEGPMKGAAIGHANQLNTNSRFIGLSEPSIIAAEPPNALVNELVIMPDIEKRLEAFARIAHGLIIFPGGPGTAEELLYILGILMHPENKKQVLPIILTGPASSSTYFANLNNFLITTLGEDVEKYYEIIIDNPVAVGRYMKKCMPCVKKQRIENEDAYSFNWSLKIDPEFQHPFEPTHENITNLDLHFNQPLDQLAANLRRIFSAIVAGNVKDTGIREIKKHGRYKIHGDQEIMQQMDVLLTSYVEQQRMKLPGSKYEPCYEIIS